jgi:catechol 2,3-dioxygenase-like lactoylglutathione lyase family enzyme
MAIVSTIKTVVQAVNNLDKSRKLYEQGLDLTCIGEEEIITDQIGELWGIEGGKLRIARYARDGEKFGCIDLVEWSNATGKTMRDINRPFDFGIMTLNYRTANIKKAVTKLQAFGCEPVSDILSYNAGKPMQEVMLNTPTGERLTILQIGDPTDDTIIFNEAVATIGMVVPSMESAQTFYREALGLEIAIAFQAAGSPFDSLLGVNQLDKLDFATLTSEGNWTGKVELLELGVGNETPINTNEFADFSHTGYTFLTFLTDNLDNVKTKCESVGAKIVVSPIEVVRPFHGKVRAMIVRSLGGEYLEIIEHQ